MEVEKLRGEENQQQQLLKQSEEKNADLTKEVTSLSKEVSALQENLQKAMNSYREEQILRKKYFNTIEDIYAKADKQIRNR